MSSISNGLMRLVLMAGLVVGVAMFVGCGGGSDDGGEDGGDSSSDRGGSDGGDRGGSGGGDAGGSTGGGSAAGGSSSNAGSASIDHSSPEALFRSVLRAGEARDFKAIAEAYPPSAHGEMAMGMIAMSTMTMMSPSTDQDAIRTVLEKYGIDPNDLPALGPQMQQEAQALADGIDDKTGFFGDMMGTLPEVQADAINALGLAEGVAIDSMSLSDVQIDGDSATAVVNAAGQTGGEERRMNFVREDGKWYMGLDAR